MNDNGSHSNDADGYSSRQKQAPIVARQFVVNLVTERLLAAMNVSAAECQSEESELTAVDLHTAAQSVRVKPSRLAAAQASLECELFQLQPLGANALYNIGEVVMFHVANHLLGPRLQLAVLRRLGGSVPLRSASLPKPAYPPGELAGN
jgi:flavin reductase (DIM6/NTAB) family NADH-FMN oxidoreductase RutF